MTKRLAATRAAMAAFWMATAFYALLAAIPFASKQFLEPRLIPAISTFAELHRWFAVAAFAVAVAGLLPWIRRRDRRVVVWTAASGLATLIAALSPGLAALEPSPVAVATAVAALVPPAWLSLLDLSPSRGGDADDRSGALGPSLDFVACAAAALVVAAASVTATLLGDDLASNDAAGIDVVETALLHLVVFSAGFAALSVIRGLGQFTLRAFAVEAWLMRLAVATLITLYLSRVLLPALSWTGPAGLGMAAAIGVALALIVGPRGTSAPAGVTAALSGLFPRWGDRSLAAGIAWLTVAMGLFVVAAARASASDWNFVIVKFLALAAWLVALTAMLRLVNSARPAGATRQPALALLPFAACLVLLVVQQVAGGGVPAHAAAAASLAARIDASTRLIVDALTPAAVIDSGLFDYLQRHTNIPRSVAVKPVAVDFAPVTGPSPRRPHIFLFVIDSLRRDYVSPYNPAVTFTPSIGRFASENTVFERAFTRYGATGLSVPAMWVGGLVLHKQYVTPFAPMNTLAKLLDGEGYRQWLSADDIIDAIVPAPAQSEPLDAAVAVKDRRLCTTLSDVRGRLDRLSPAEPTFVYALPQDVHVSAITREGGRPIDDDSYPGFNAAYASRVKRLDDCFGAFVDDLKGRGIYDDSLIILTSDHGDSLGEGGRMGHAYTIYPEIVQVPLLVHLPADMRARFAASPQALAFTSDITPSLYALLGHQPVAPASLFGQPLFSTGALPVAPRQAQEVIASSYGSVYGALLDDARRLYIVDAVSLREYAYELDGSAAGRAIPVGAADRQIGQRAIRDTVDEISRFYKFDPSSH